jgi:hypothetical protein
MLTKAIQWWPWIRFQRPMYTKPNRRWLWTPLTDRFGHGGWVYLSLPWLWRFRNGA